MVGLYVFVLATLAGREVITKVPPTLHTPLMSGANAVSGIAIVGALVVAGRADGMLQTVLGVTAITMAMVNVVGGFLVTDRMLSMFRKR
ncbi:MAG: NAD(P) transhydrogenase subunit alpha [Gemmatimonadota bacterium]|nr:NAD(P) transhydrogenase subunit alpha [Gemmatimonadota bacterium]MDH3422042.1 NAD(P) transhydrogenase subunit alpha [Gemmatimonadota bacterium]